MNKAKKLSAFSDFALLKSLIICSRFKQEIFKRIEESNATMMDMSGESVWKIYKRRSPRLEGRSSLKPSLFNLFLKTDPK